MVQQEAIGIKYPLVAIKFSLANTAANQDGTAVPADTNGDGYNVGLAGSIVGMAVSLNAAVTANTITFKPTVGGTESTAIAVQLDSVTYTQRKSQWVAYGTIPFAANALLGVVYDSHASYTPTTADVVVVLFVVLEKAEW